MKNKERYVECGARREIKLKKGGGTERQKVAELRRFGRVM